MDESQPIEETGNLLILAYAYTLASGNTTFADNYTSLFQSYADYLVSNGLYISDQLATNDAAGPLPNQTNLAIKAAIGLTAFGALTGMTNYTAVGQNFAYKLYDQALGTDPNRTHFVLEYGNTSTYTIAFNLYPDILLNLSTFPAAAFQMQTDYYPTRRAEGGVALDSRVDWAKTDWALFAAASVTEKAVRDMFIGDVHAFVSEDTVDNQVPFSDRFFVTEDKGDIVDAFYQWRARPVVGGHFAVLALSGDGEREYVSQRKRL